MAESKVYFTDFRTIAFGDSLPIKLKKLIRKRNNCMRRKYHPNGMPKSWLSQWRRRLKNKMRYSRYSSRQKSLKRNC